MVPFLHRCEKHSPGAASELLREYLVTLAKGDLRLPLKIFQHSKPDLQQKIIPDQDQLMATVLECIYSCGPSNQLPLCYGILDCLPQRGPGPAPFLLPDGLVCLVNRQISWHLVLASNGKLLAAVQDQCVEIRSAKDDFTSVIGKCQVPKDPKPQWRRVAWSYDCTLLAYAESMGTVRVFDLMGSELFVIAPASSFAGDLSCAIPGLIFLEYKASAQWLAELLVINYRGELRSYLVSVETNQSYQESHSFSFSSHYPHGISTAIYHPAHSTHAGCGRRSDSSDFWEGTRSWQVCPTVVVLDDVHPLDGEMYGTFKHLLVVHPPPPCWGHTEDLSCVKRGLHAEALKIFKSVS
ncbi:NBAS subunit of NRZ tethering complex-like isoform X4 [Cavia porcellus]|uniref:NBAS subunit of NRZ tethering complex-like isoform X4 n=1 Tax=Cavia porcellus TaxID=10141 RepID=UPI002FE19877